MRLFDDRHAENENFTLDELNRLYEANKLLPNQSNQLIIDEFNNLLEDGRLYILNKHYEPFIPDTIWEYCRWHNNYENKIIGFTQIGDNYTITTTFSRMCSGYGSDKVFFESKISSFPSYCEQLNAVQRYKTIDEAVAGHLVLVKHYIEVVEMDKLEKDEQNAI